MKTYKNFKYIYFSSMPIISKGNHIKPHLNDPVYHVRIQVETIYNGLSKVFTDMVKYVGRGWILPKTNRQNFGSTSEDKT